MNKELCCICNKKYTHIYSINAWYPVGICFCDKHWKDWEEHQKARNINKERSNKK